MAEKQRRRTSRTDPGPLEGRREVASVRCPFCHADVPQDALAAKCGKCQTVHHASCFDEKGGCSVDGCGGKGALVVKGWRAALGECRACRAKVYLDENVAVCASCESIHHPPCLEARDGCAECGCGEGMLVSAKALVGGRSSFGVVFALVPILVGLAVTIGLVVSGVRGPAGIPLIGAGIVVPFGVVLGRKLDAARRRRLLAAGEKVAKPTTVAPPKPES